MPQPRQLKVALTLEVNTQFLADHPLTTDWVGLFGPLDRSRFHFLVGEADHTLGKTLTEIARFFLDDDRRSDETDDDRTNGELVRRGEQLKEQLRRYLLENYDL